MYSLIKHVPRELNQYSVNGMQKTSYVCVPTMDNMPLNL